jgi:hypothetical protein
MSKNQKIQIQRERESKNYKEEKRGGDVVLNFKILSKIKDRAEKLEKILELHNSASSAMSELEGPCRSFFYISK